MSGEHGKEHEEHGGLAHATDKIIPESSSEDWLLKFLAIIALILLCSVGWQWYCTGLSLGSASSPQTAE